MAKTNLFWFRRDLRLSDNRGLYEALMAKQAVQCVFIFDLDILKNLEDQDDARVSFIHQELTHLKERLESFGSSLDVRIGKPLEVWADLVSDYDIESVYSNKDYEPYGIARDRELETVLNAKQIPLYQFNDHLIFHPSEILKKDGLPYLVFTPYSKKWKSNLFDDEVINQPNNASRRFDRFPSEHITDRFLKSEEKRMLPLTEIGFTHSNIELPKNNIASKVIVDYEETRNFPGLDATSKLGIHLRFGTISVRQLARTAAEKSETFLNELIWREFYSMILFHFPKVVNECFREKYNHIEWRNDEREFEAWCGGQTGYPLVDAGMRQLNETGFMHNRVRMVTASFLTKHLLIDWRWGEAYFARKLLDFELASNNGGWQWAAGCGTDAAPYFRIFNPTLQLKKFDRENVYINKWIAEWGTNHYPAQIVNHEMARKRCLDVFKKALN